MRVTWGVVVLQVFQQFGEFHTGGRPAADVEMDEPPLLEIVDEPDLSFAF